MRYKQRKYEFRIARPEDKFRTDLVSIFQHPEPDTRYCLGLDAATGFGADYTSMQVWSCRLPFEQVAWLRNKRTTTPVGSEVMVALARYYNNAFIVPEVRFPGNAYVDNAIGYNYNNIYQKTQTLDENPSESSKYGISTTETDKHLLVNNFKELTEGVELQTVFHDEITIYEFCNYVYLEDKDKMGGGEGFHDDTVMATLLALYGCSKRPQEAREVLEEYDVENEQAAHFAYLQEKHRQSLFGKKEEEVIVL